MKISIKKYLLYSSVFAIFTEAFMVHFIIDLKLIYLILLVNYVLLIKIKKITFNIYFIYLLLFLLAHGLIMFAIIGIAPTALLAQIIGIVIIGTYYYNFILLYDKTEIVRVYNKLCLYVAGIGYPLWLFNINSNDGLRFQSIFTEPAHYAIVVLPCCYYFLRNKNYLWFAIVFVTLLLSRSAIGYIGCGLMFIVPNLSYKRVLYLIAMIPVVAGVFYIIYQQNVLFKIRVDDTYKSINAINNGKFKGQTNVSSYALMSNLFVAKCNVIDHPLGSGLGSHYYMHTKVYSKKIEPPVYVKTLKLDKINAPDANSLFLRMVSDLGIFGLLLIFGLMYLALHSFAFKDLYFAQGIVIYLLLKLFRDGHYFPPEFYFFIWILYFSLKDKWSANKALATQQ